MIVSGSYDGLIRLWDTTTGQCLKTLVHREQTAVGGVNFTPSSSHLLCASLDNTIRIWDMYNSKIVKTYSGHANTKFPLTARLTLSPTQRHNEAEWREREEEREKAIMIGSEDGKVYIWDVQSKEVILGLASA